MAFDHVDLIRRDPKAAADWYREMCSRVERVD